MTTSYAKLYFNKRKEPRNSYSGLISFVYRKNLYTGKLKNYSPSGLFIECGNFFVEGEMITVTLPVSEFKNHKQSGRIIWTNDNGSGIQLLG
jgi:hypothetical protein